MIRPTQLWAIAWSLLALAGAEAQDSVVVFNEIHFRTSPEESEWIELHNQMAADVDLSGWRLRGAIRYDFPDETVLAGGGYLVVAADPATVRNRGPFVEILGPFAGRLDNAGETIRLEDGSTLGTVPGGAPRHRVMDEISYTGEALPEESLGLTWAKIDPDGGTASAHNWTLSQRDGGTPGSRNFRDGLPQSSDEAHVLGAVVINEIMYRARPQYESPPVLGEYESTPLIEPDDQWQLDTSGEAPAETWMLGGNEWASMPGPFGVGLENGAVVVQTELPLKKSNGGSVNVYHFAHTFTFDGDVSAWDDLALDLLIDDGAIVYLNGEEILRTNLPEGELTTRTSALTPIGAPEWQELGGIDPQRLQVGENVLAVAVHQYFTLFDKSDDAAFAARLRGRTVAKPPIPAQPHRESGEEWIELYNRHDSAVDLSDWKLDGGVDYEFPDGTSLAAGGYLVIDDFRGTLSNGSEQLLLIDGAGQTVDAVRYQDNGRWPREADGDGSSLELRNPHIDNTVAESWAASDERNRSSWQTYTYEGVAVNDGIGTSLYHELVIGMLDAGEILLDDISVLEDPHGAAVEFMQNGGFEEGTLGEMPEHWLAVGTHGSHGNTRLVEDPDLPGNQVLHLVATGATEDKHNQLTSVYANGERLRGGETYRISFRAKWLAGANLLNTRLYFNDLQRTTRLTVPEPGGTPGEQNSTFAADLGPALDHLSQSPVLPVAQEPVVVRVRASDPDGIDSLTLTYAINGGTLFSGGTHVIDMQQEEDDLYAATIPGRPVDDLVRIHVTATDTLGNTNFFPREGPDARAMYEVVDDAELEDGPHRFRVLMEKKDRDFLFEDANRMSNDRIGGTVIYKDIAYHNVGIRLKGSAWARNNTPFQGLNVRFDPEHPFRGVHETVSLERDPGKGEIVAQHLFYAAGGKLPSYYNDVVQLDFDQPSFTGRVLLLMGRTSGPFLRGTFDNASEGTVFNLELLYTPQATLDGRPESPKRPFPYTHDNGRYDFRVMGDDKEAYRWGFQIRSGRDRDQYGAIVRAARAMEEELAFDAATEAAFDIDQWTRAFAMMALNGNDDFYTRLWEHNLRLYHRAEDDRLLALPWDFDRAWRLASSSPLIGKRNNNGTEVTIPLLLERPANLRRFHGHLLDMLDSVYNEDYVDRWARHYGSLFRSNLNSVTSYVRSRANFARNQLPDPVDFAITTNGGDDFSTDQPLVTLQGRGWIDVDEIRLQNESFSLPLTWRNASSWSLDIPVTVGANAIRLEAFNLRDEPVGTASITVTGTATEVFARSDNLTISEIHYHPADNTPTEFIELWNRSDATVLLEGTRFDDGVVFTFDDLTLEPGERAVLVQDSAAFTEAYPSGGRVLGQFQGRLNNGGETLRLLAASGALIAEITYGDDEPWPADADGGGRSLVYVSGDTNEAASWTVSPEEGGSPGTGTPDTATPIDYASWKQSHGITDDDGDEDGDGLTNLMEYALGGHPEENSAHTLPRFMPDGTLRITKRAGATDLQISLEVSPDLVQWSAVETFKVVSTVNENGRVIVSYKDESEERGHQVFIRLRTLIADPL